MLISCVEDLSYHTSININLHLFGLLLSTALLVVSLAIFTIFPRLKDFHVTTLATIKVQWWTFYSSLSCTRVAVHRNFFLSLVCLSITTTSPLSFLTRIPTKTTHRRHENTTLVISTTTVILIKVLSNLAWLFWHFLVLSHAEVWQANLPW